MTVMQAIRVAAATRRAAASATTLRSMSTAVMPPPLYITGPNGKVLSPWHDIPLRPSADPSVFNFVCEIPKGVKPPKLEIDTGKQWNPIVQDKTKTGEPRFYKLDSLIHYGALPQTWENPDHKDSWTGLLGDGDPIDVCEIATHVNVKPGNTYKVKVLGALAMIDGGETDWKILAVRTDDPLAQQVDDIANAPDQVKKLADDVREWFRTYKIPEGKGENSFAFDGKWLDRDTALKVIESTHVQWKEAVAKRTGTQEKKAPWLPALDWKQPGAEFLQASDLKVGQTIKLA